MIWPWRSAAREEQLKLLNGYLERDLKMAAERERYWRDRYERLADLMLVRQVNPNAVTAVHVEPPADSGATLGVRVARVAGVVGSARGIPFEHLHHATAADTPSR